MVSYFNRFPKQALVFMCLQLKSFENTDGKREIARNEQFLLFFFSTAFSAPFGEVSVIFIEFKIDQI